MGLDYDTNSVTERLSKARAWLKKYNPTEMIELREDVNQEYVDSMSEEAKSLVRKMYTFLRETDIENLSVEKLEEVLYRIPRIDTLQPSELKKVQRAFFKDIYHLLIGKDTGPRLATFVWGVDKEQILKLLNI